MSIIENFTAREFWNEQYLYYKKLNQLKERVAEICSDFNKLNRYRHIEDIDIFEDDENEEEYYIAVLFSDSDRFVFPAEWLNSDEYKDKANKAAAQIREEEFMIQYKEYLRLKEIFEPDE